METSNKVQNQQLKIYQKPQSSWMGKYLISNSVGLGMNTYFLYKKCGIKSFLYCNTPVRVYMLYQSIREKKVYQTVINVASYTSLFFPNYRLLSIGLDCLSQYITYKEFRNTGTQSKEMDSVLKSRLNAENFEEACKVLGITKEQANDQAFVSEKKNNLIQKLERKKEKTEKTSKYMAQQIQILINDAEKAFNTIKKAQSW